MTETVQPGRRARRRFSWEAVPPHLVRSLLAALYVGEDPGHLHVADDHQLRSWAHTRFSTPPSEAVIERHHPVARVLREWFEHAASDETVSRAADSVWRSGRHDGRPPTTPAACREFLARRRLAATYRGEIRRAFLSAHRRMSETSEPTLPTPRRRGVRRLSGCGEAEGQVPWEHQEKAWAELDALATETHGDRRGLVVLPTGAGKTFTMVRWLVQRLEAEPGLRVLWLAHQQELLEQAAERFMAEARRLKPGFERGLRVVASHADTATTIAAADADVVISTWQSLYSQWTRQERVLQGFMQAGPCAVVVDEAHRASARGYQDILDLVVDHGGDVVVGLTATPWPRTPGARKRLDRVFPRRVVDVAPEELYAAGVLARPTVHRVNTGEVMRLTEAEASQLSDDLPAAVLNRLAIASRDDFIVRHWDAQPVRWGKTLVFATGKEHADRLAERFQTAGHQAWSVHSSSSRPRDEVLSEFRRHRGPGVLVSVGMLTEGVDVPDARTAFLARPTCSPILMRQMIGRVLRGPQAGGTSEAHVVHFRDDWDELDSILDPVDVEIGDDDPNELGTSTLPPLVADDGKTIDPVLIRQLEHRLRRDGVGVPVVGSAGCHLIGYLDLGPRKVPVFDGQDVVWDDVLEQALGGASWRGRSLDRLFVDVPAGGPGARDLREVIRFARETGERPLFVPITLTIDARTIAREVDDLGPHTERQRRTWFEERWHEVGRVAWPSVQHMIDAVGDALGELGRQRSGGRMGVDPETVRAATPGLPRMPVDRTRVLPALDHVVERMRHLVDHDVAAGLDRVELPALEWTRTVATSAFAHYSRLPKRGGGFRSIIKVSRLLQAPAAVVSDEALAYLVFHELLHHVLPGQGHDAEFRRLEGLWPEADRLDAELDTLAERYDLNPKRDHPRH